MEGNAVTAKRGPGRPRKNLPVLDASAQAQAANTRQPEKPEKPQDFPSVFDPVKFAEEIAKRTGIDYEKLGAAIGIAIVQGFKASNTDPDKERIKQIRREEMRETQRQARKADVDRWLACDHMRTHPYSGTARIGWATQSDGLTRGTCMGCGCPFTPVLEELPDPVRMKDLYAKYRAIPVTIARNDFLQGMVVAGNPA